MCIIFKYFCGIIYWYFCYSFGERTRKRPAQMSAAGFKKNRYNIKPSTLFSGQIFFIEKTLYRSSLVSECQAHCTSVLQYKVCRVLLALVETTQVQAYYYLRPFSILC